MDAFTHFRDELDAFHDTREKLIKTSRDITNLAKKTIFLLHRIALEPGDNPGRRAAAQGRHRLNDIQVVYANCSPLIAGDAFHRYHRQVSPGLQEYIEALSFAHYLEHNTLISHAEAQASLSGPDGTPYVPLTVEDYLLGLSDLTGELMRFAISVIGGRGGRAKALDVCSFVRACRADFERFVPHVRDLAKKQAVTTQSLEKIEDATYALVVRSSEYDLPPEMLDDIVAQATAQPRYSERNTRGAGDDVNIDQDDR